MENSVTKNNASNTTYKFKYGLPGFEHLSEFEFVNLDDFPPFKLFRSTISPEISMIVIDGQLLDVFKSVNLPSFEMQILEINKRNDMRIFVILRIDENARNFVANTRAPIILNIQTGFGKQIILDDKNLSEEYLMGNPLENN